jgi:hypothetical protein
VFAVRDERCQKHLTASTGTANETGRSPGYPENRRIGRSIQSPIDPRIGLDMALQIETQWLRSRQERRPTIRDRTCSAGVVVRVEEGIDIQEIDHSARFVVCRLDRSEDVRAAIQIPVEFNTVGCTPLEI